MPHVVIINGTQLQTQESDTLAIGTALSQLSTLHSQGQLTPQQAGPFDFFELDHRHSGGTGDGSDEIDSICESLAIATIGRSSAGWEVTHKTGPGDPDGIEAEVTIRFVFEKDNEMVVVVPYQDTLEFGQYDGQLGTTGIHHRPPMDEPDYYANLPEARALIQRYLNDLVTALGPGTHTIGEIQTEGEHARDVLIPDPTAARRKELFHDQLGAYSVRQCS